MKFSNYWTVWLPNENGEKKLSSSRTVSEPSLSLKLSKVFLLSFDFLLFMLATSTLDSGTEILDLMKFLYFKLSTQWWYVSTDSIFYFYEKVTDLYTCNEHIHHFYTHENAFNVFWHA